MTPHNRSANVLRFSLEGTASRESTKAARDLSDAQFNVRFKRLPKPVQTIKQRADVWLAEHLDSVLAKVDDALFELASNAQKQSEQDDYFFAMRELRNNHQAFLAAFQSDISQGFIGCLEEAEGDAPTIESLAVIGNEEFDEILAIEATIKRSEKDNKPLLAALAKRLAAICDYDENISAIPLSPSALCNSLKAAAAFLRLSPNARLVLFKLFEQGVIFYVAELYSVVNKHLAECGILPDLNNHLAQANRHRAIPKKNKIIKPEEGGLTGEVVTLDENNVAFSGDNKNTQTSNSAKINTVQTGDCSAPSSGRALPVCDQTESGEIQQLTQKIHSLQQLINNNIIVDAQDVNSGLDDAACVTPGISHLSMSHSATINPSIKTSNATTQGFQHNVQQLLTLLADLQNKASAASFARPNSLNQLLGCSSDSLDGVSLAGLFPQSPERKTLQMVDALFGAMLTEKSLSRPLKELLARLQIPLARAAVVDPDILNNPDHSARQLINALAKAGLAWQSDDVSAMHKDPLYKKMQSIVEHAAHEFNNDSQLFTDLVDDLEAFTQREQKRLTLLEKRMIDAEQGRAKAEAAHLAVANMLGEACANVKLDGVLNEFIFKAWQQVLYVTCLKYGEDSSQWHTAVKPLNDLMASLKNINDFMGCERACKKSEALIEVFRQGLEGIGFDAFEADRLLARVAQWYKQLKLQANLDETKHTQFAQASKKTALANVVNNHCNERTQNNDTQPNNTQISNTQISNTQNNDTQNNDTQNNDTQNSATQISTKPATTTLLTSNPVSGQNQASSDVPDNRYYEQARALQRGAWVDYRQKNQCVIRCRLAAVIESTSTYIFVDRQGHKVLELSLLALALALQSQILNAIEDSHLFDRALEQVIVSLRKKDSH